MSLLQCIVSYRKHPLLIRESLGQFPLCLTSYDMTLIIDNYGRFGKDSWYHKTAIDLLSAGF